MKYLHPRYIITISLTTIIFKAKIVNIIIIVSKKEVELR